MNQPDLFALQPPRFEIGGSWFSNVDRMWYVGPCCIDVSWPWLNPLAEGESCRNISAQSVTYPTRSKRL